MSIFPQEGQTIKAHCKDLGKVTEWTVIKTEDTYMWACSECAKKITIGEFKKEGKVRQEEF